ncbi:MAG TPA: hypothetical protein VLY87_00400 [Flavobacterium sp.]|nr:hypothetical protein [Flavobacterium sp.]
MKKIFTLALIALSLSGFAQQRQLVKQQENRQQDYRGNEKGRHHKDYNYGKFSFNRLDLTHRQERLLVDILKDKQNEERYIIRKFRNPEQKLRMLDRTYDRKIQSVLSRSQYDKWSRIYAYQYESYGNKRWS